MVIYSYTARIKDPAFAFILLDYLVKSMDRPTASFFYRFVWYHYYYPYLVQQLTIRPLTNYSSICLSGCACGDTDHEDNLGQRRHIEETHEDHNNSAGCNGEFLVHNVHTDEAHDLLRPNKMSSFVGTTSRSIQHKSLKILWPPRNRYILLSESLSSFFSRP